MVVAVFVLAMKGSVALICRKHFLKGKIALKRKAIIHKTSF